MIKNKLKFVIFFCCFLLFLIVGNNKVSASEYNVEVTSIEGLVYGSELKNAKIKGNSSIEGSFSFYNSDIILDSVGNVNIEVLFVPSDLDNYDVKKINVLSYVSRRKIEIIFNGVIRKQYDGLSSINLPAYSYEGIIDDEVSVVGNLKGELKGIYVGEDIGIVLSGVEIVGEKKDCYYLDLLEHRGHVYPSTLEKEGENATKITLDKNVYVDTRYRLQVSVNEEVKKINSDYSSFKKFNYNVYNHNNVKIDVEGKFNVMMIANKEDINNERFALFELTRDGEYRQIDYDYHDGKLIFEIDSDSSVVFTTRNIEYDLLILFGGILLFSLVFVIVYAIKNSKMKEEVIY